MSPSGKDSADNRLLRLPNLLLMLWHSATDVSGRQMSLMVSIIPVYLSLKSWNPCHSDKVHCSLQLMLSNVGPNTLTRIRPPNVSSPFPRILETLKNRHEVCKTIHTFWGQNLLQKREIKTMKTICYHTVLQLYIPRVLYNIVEHFLCTNAFGQKQSRGRMWRDRWQTENQFGVNFEHFCRSIFCTLGHTLEFAKSVTHLTKRVDLS